MLAGVEFTVGTLADAQPLSLMLPRSKNEATALIGQSEKGPAAIFIGGRYSFYFIEVSKGANWKGLLIPHVRVEVDETSLFDPYYLSAPLGSVVRTDTRLVILANTEHSFGQRPEVTLESGLPPANELSAAFSRWCVTIGSGPDKRILKEVDTETETAIPS